MHLLKRESSKITRLKGRAGLGYRSFDSAERPLQGVEAVHMIRTGQELYKADKQEHARFVASLLQTVT